VLWFNHWAPALDASSEIEDTRRDKWPLLTHSEQTPTAPLHLSPSGCRTTRVADAGVWTGWKIKTSVICANWFCFPPHAGGLHPSSARTHAVPGPGWQVRPVQNPDGHGRARRGAAEWLAPPRPWLIHGLRLRNESFTYSNITREGLFPEQRSQETRKAWLQPQGTAPNRCPAQGSADESSHSLGGKKSILLLLLAS